jgi:hypothetical protein
MSSGTVYISLFTLQYTQLARCHFLSIYDVSTDVYGMRRRAAVLSSIIIIQEDNEETKSKF